MTRFIPLALVAVIALPLSGCETLATIPLPTPEPPGSARTTQLAFTFNGFEAIKDCDGIEGLGDFDFRASVRLSSNEAQSGQVASATPQLSDGQRTSGGSRTVYEFPARDGEAFRVTFRASEIDSQLIGPDFNDSRMDNQSATAVHNYRNGTWEKTGPKWITLGGGSKTCRVRMHYNLEQLS